jgi:hypothetical protein
VSWFRLLVAGFSPRRPGFDPRPIRMSFVVEKITLRQVLLLVRVRRFFPFNIIPPVLHTTRCFHQDKEAKPGKYCKSNNLTNTEKHWIEKNFYVIFTTAKARVWSLFSLCEILMGEMALELGFLQILWFYPVIFISAMLHTHLHSHVTLNRRTMDRLGTFQKVVLFCKSVSVN